jgi:hypothetical protein
MNANTTVDLLLYSSPLLFSTRARVLAHLFVDQHNGFHWVDGGLVLQRAELGTLEEFAAWCRAQHDAEDPSRPATLRLIQIEQLYETTRSAARAMGLTITELTITEEAFGFSPMAWRPALWPESKLLCIPDDITRDWMDLANEAIDTLHDRIVPAPTENVLASERLGERLIHRPPRVQQEAWLAEAAERLRHLRAR